jgi:hypothetical protein
MNSFMAWIEQRLPFMDAMNKHAIQYPAPKKFQLLVCLWYFSNGSFSKPNLNRCLVNHELRTIW